MTNEVKINLTRDDIAKAIEEYVNKKYPTFSRISMYIEFNTREQSGYVKGTIKEG